MTAGKAPTGSISKDVLWEEYYVNLHGAYNAMRDAFTQSGFTQDELALRLNCDKSLISKRLNGAANLTLKTLSFMGTAMECRLKINFVPFAQVGTSNHFFQTALHESTSANTSSTVSVDIAVQSTLSVDTKISKEIPVSGNRSKILEPS